MLAPSRRHVRSWHIAAKGIAPGLSAAGESGRGGWCLAASLATGLPCGRRRTGERRMPAAHTSTKTNDLARMRDRCRRAYLAAREGDVGAQVLADRRYAQVLSAIEGQPAAARVVMLQRAAVWFEITVDMRTWPDRIRGLGGALKAQCNSRRSRP